MRITSPTCGDGLRAERVHPAAAPCATSLDMNMHRVGRAFSTRTNGVLSNGSTATMVTDVTDVPEPEGRAEWERRSDAMEQGQAATGAYPVPGLLRRARRMADLSQR